MLNIRKEFNLIIEDTCEKCPCCKYDENMRMNKCTHPELVGTEWIHEDDNGKLEPILPQCPLPYA